MRRSALAFAVLLIGSSFPAFCVEVAWVRILSGDAESVTWRPGESWPAWPSGFPFAPSAVLSYATVSPGDSMTDAELGERARTWGRALDESRRFPRSSVLVAELGEGSDRRGVIVEAETGATPLFDGGMAYASMTLPLLGGRRAALAVAAGPNLGSVSYRDETLGDGPFVLGAGLSYANDLLETGRFSGNRFSGFLGLGPRLGSFSDVLLRARTGLPLEAADSGPFLALGAALELGALSLFSIDGLDGSLVAQGDWYAGISGFRYEAGSNLLYGAGPATVSLAAGAGASFGPIEARERFDLRSGEGLLRGPEPYSESVGEFVLGRVDVDYSALKLSLASWFPTFLGPFAFCEAARAPTGADAAPLLSGAAGAGLRVRLGPPVGVTVDVGYALSDRGVGALVIYMLSFDPRLGKELR